MYKKYKKQPNKSAYLLKTVILLRGKYATIYGSSVKCIDRKKIFIL